MQEQVRALLEQLVAGERTLGEVAAALHVAPEAMDFATIDHDRAERCGSPEVIYAAGKTATQIVDIAGSVVARHELALITRATDEQADAVAAAFDEVETTPRRSTLLVGAAPEPQGTSVPIITAGTSDEPVADEAALTCRAMGQPVHRVTDVGVAGLSRLLARLPELREASVVICIAGMEGALPSVVGGLVSAPVIAVPTSVGYGAAMGGLAALLGMLTSCASGVAVVNIDNGFGAAYTATLIQRAADGRSAPRGRCDG